MSRALLTILALLAVCAPAQAAERQVAKYRTFTLHAEEKGSEVCMTLRRERRYQGHACGRIPRSPHRVVSILPDVGWNNYAAAVPFSVRSAEIEYDNGRRERVPTFGRRGFAARFVILPASPPAAKFIRWYAGDGTLLGMDGGPAGYIGYDENGTQLLGEDRGTGVRAYTEPRIVPSPDEPDRIRTLACVGVTNNTGGSGVCDDDSENAVVVMGSCDEPGQVGAIVGPGVASMRLALGSGAEIVVPATELPAPFTGRRAIAAQVPAGEAVRAAAAVDAAGVDVAWVTVGLAPGGQPCAGEDRGDDRFSATMRPVSAPPGVAVAGPLVAGDQGERLCVALHALPAATCALPPVDSDRPRLLRVGGDVGGVLSRDADRITLELSRGASVTVRATDGAAYTGRWADKVRFLSATVPDDVEITGAVVRNAAGVIIGVSDRGLPRPAEQRRVLIDRGGIGLQLVQREGDEPCVTAFATVLPPSASYCTVRNPGRPIDGPVRRYSGTITVACAPRQAIAYGRVADELRTPELVLEGGVIVRAARIKLPDMDAWVAFVPDARVVGLRAAGEEAVSLNLPPASAECGYSTDRSF